MPNSAVLKGQKSCFIQNIDKMNLTYHSRQKIDIGQSRDKNQGLKHTIINANYSLVLNVTCNEDTQGIKRFESVVGFNR